MNVYKEKLAIDSNRHIDANGYLHVTVSPLTKETVNPYKGCEIPKWESLGLDSEKIYRGYRSGAELEKAVNTFNGIPLLIEHKFDSADDPLKEERIGSVGTNAEWKPPYIMNALTVTDAYAIELIKSGAQKELSACYRYRAVFESGTFNGMEYDFIMEDIEANHVAIVDEGRAGADVYVYDRAIIKTTLTKEQSMAKKVEDLQKALSAFKEASDGLLATFNSFLEEKAPESGQAEDEAKEDPETKSEDSKPECAEKAADSAEGGAEAAAEKEDAKSGEDTPKAELDKSEPAAAKDRKLTMDRALKQAEDRGAEKAVVKMRVLFEAAEAVRPTLIVKPVAYDSAEDIYAKALKVEGVATAGVDKSAYRALYLAVLGSKSAGRISTECAADKAPVDTAFSKHIRIED